MSEGRTTGRRPLWRRIRLNRHGAFALHVIAYLVVGIWIWTLPAPTLDKRFDVLLWLTILMAHGMVVYYRRRGTFVFHLLMVVAGNGAIWSTTARVEDKVTVNLAWIVVSGIIGVWLFRHAVRSGTLSPRARVPSAPAHEVGDEEWFEDAPADAPAKPKRARSAQD